MGQAAPAGRGGRADFPGFAAGTDATGKLYGTLANGSQLVVVNKNSGDSNVLGPTTAQSAVEVVAPAARSCRAPSVLGATFASAARPRRGAARCD